MPRYPHPTEYTMWSDFRNEGYYSRSDVPVRIWLRDVVANFDSLYGEADHEFGADLVLGEERSVGELGATWFGPFDINARTDFLESGREGGVGFSGDDIGYTVRASANFNFSCRELRRLRMVESSPPEALRLPTINDIVELYGDEDWRNLHDKYGSGPWYFSLLSPRFLGQIGASNYWTEMISIGEYQSNFDPSRLVTGKSLSTPRGGIEQGRK
jgi:hypothetical protein